MDKKELELTPEEAKAEQDALIEAKEDEVRASVIEEFGFDLEADAEKIEKAVEKELGHKKSLSTAIGQKIKYREALKNPPAPKEVPKELPVEKVSDVVAAELEKRDLESLDYSDELKQEIAKVAKIQGVSIKKASQDPYIISKIEAYKEQLATDEAAISRTKKTSGKVAFDANNPPDVDMSTEEGRKKWDEYKDWLKNQDGYRASDATL